MRSKTNWISPPCSFLLLFTSSLLHSSIPCHSSSSHCSHTVDPNSFIQDSQASPWDTHHTPMPSITSKHGACSQALPHVLSHVDVLSVNTRRRFLEHACLQCSHQYQEVVDMGSVLPISGLLCPSLLVLGNWPSGIFASLPTSTDQGMVFHAGN